MKNIQDLSEKELNQFIDEYYNSELSIKKILEKYELDIIPSKVKSILPNIEVDFLCPYCNINMYEEPLSRTEYKSSQKYKHSSFFRRKADIFCKECTHQDYKNEFNKHYCNCNNCTGEKNKNNELKIQEAKNYVNQIINSQKNRSISLEEIKYESIEIKTYLLTLLLYLYDDKAHIFKPINNLDGIKFTSNDSFGFHIINELLGYIIRFQNTPNIYSLISQKEDTRYSYEPYNCTYSLNLDDDIEINFSKLVLLCENIEYYEDIEKEALSLWQKIAKDELKEYLYLLFDKYNFDTDYIGDAILEKLDLILEDFSVSEGYAILYSSVNAAASYKQTGINHKHAVNSINSYIANNILKRKSGEWERKGYRRNYDLPQTAISITFFNNILKIGDKGFTQVPKLENIPKFYTDYEYKENIDFNSIEYSNINLMLFENLYKVVNKIYIDDLLPQKLKEEAHTLISNKNDLNEYEYSIEANNLLKFILKLKGFEIK